MTSLRCLGEQSIRTLAPIPSMLDRLNPNRQFVVFLIGGTLSAVIDVGLMQGLVIGGIHYLSAATVGFLVGLLFNYVFHACFTFRTPLSGRSFLRYLILVAANYTFTLAAVSVFVYWGALPIVGKIVSLPIIAINGFLLGKYWIFK